MVDNVFIKLTTKKRVVAWFTPDRPMPKYQLHKGNLDYYVVKGPYEEQPMGHEVNLQFYKFTKEANLAECHRIANLAGGTLVLADRTSYLDVEYI